MHGKNVLSIIICIEISLEAGECCLNDLDDSCF